jgi:hypothetical protein
MSEQTVILATQPVPTEPITTTVTEPQVTDTSATMAKSSGMLPNGPFLENFSAYQISFMEDKNFKKVFLEHSRYIPIFIDEKTKTEWTEFMKLFDDSHFQKYMENITDQDIKNKLTLFRSYFIKFEDKEMKKMKFNYANFYNDYMKQFHYKQYKPLRYYLYKNQFDPYFNKLCRATSHLAKDKTGAEKTLPYPVSATIIYPGNPYLYIKKNLSDSLEHIKMLHEYPIEWLLDAYIDNNTFESEVIRKNNPAFGKVKNERYLDEKSIIYTIYHAYNRDDLWEQAIEKQKQLKSSEDENEDEEQDEDQDEEETSDDE